MRNGRNHEIVDESYVSLGIIACAHRRKQLHRKSAFSTGVALIALHRRFEGASFRRCPHPWESQESRTILLVARYMLYINFARRARFAQVANIRARSCLEAALFSRFSCLRDICSYRLQNWTFISQIPFHLSIYREIFVIFLNKVYIKHTYIL